MKKRIIFAFLICLWMLPGCNAIANKMPVIVVLDSQSINIAIGADIVDFSKIFVNAVLSETFTIKNIGKEKLLLTGSPFIEITGTGATAFTVTLQPSSQIAPNINTEFKIEFAPLDAQVYTATVIIANTDIEANPFTFTITGEGYIDPSIPEINVKQGTTDIPCTTGVFDFGSVNIGISSPAVVFTIQNLGTADLVLTGTPDKIRKTSGEANLFIINQTGMISTLQPSLKTSFTIFFSPDTVGLKLTTIVITNNDPDRNPFTFTVSGTGEVSINAPEINVKQETYNIACTTGSYNFGSVYVGNSTIDFVFTIENLGNQDLLLTGNPKIEISGTCAAMFAINETMTDSQVSPGNTTTFMITFTPTTKGSKTTTISIPNNDPDENPYVFNILGEGVTDERIIFILDQSASMSSGYRSPNPVYDRNGNVISYPNRWQYLQSETALRINSFTTNDSFDIITFHTQIFICFGALTPATNNNKQTAIAWLYGLRIDGCTNSYDALLAAFTNYGQVDTIQFITDGYPNTALSRGCCACCCNPTDWILNEADGWIAAQVALNPAFWFEVIQIGGSPMSFMVSLGSKSHATFELR